MKNKKTGFTLVELLVVIAILAILAAVSVVGYISFTDKAKEANDISLTTQMNTVLQANEATKKPDTLKDVIKQIKDDGGIDLEQITPNKDGYNYAWDKSENRILLLDGTKIVAPEDLNDTNFADTIIIVKDEDGLNKALDNGYGIALASSYFKVSTYADERTFNLEKPVSFDDYNNLVNNLTVSSSSSNNDFYITGKFSELTIDVETSVKMSIYGNTTKLNLKSGKLVIEKDANISTIYAVEAKANSKVNITSKGKVGNIFGNEEILEGSKLPDAGKPTIPSEGDELFAGGNGSINSPYLISSIEQFKNIASAPSKAYKLINNLTFTIDDLEVIEIPEFEWKDYVCINNFTGMLDGNNFLISLPTLEKSSEHGLFAHIFYNLNNVTIKNLKVDSGVVTSYSTNSHFENLTILGNYFFANNSGTIIIYAKQTNTLINCINKANINSTSYSAVFVGYSFDNTKLVFKDCYNEGAYIGDKSSLFLGNMSQSKNNLTLDITNCGNRNNGYIRSLNSNNTYYWNCFISATNGKDAVDKIVKISFNGKLVESSTMISSGFIQGANDSTLSLTLSNDNKLIVNKSSYTNVDHYLIQISYYLSNVNGMGTHLIHIEEKINKFDTEDFTANIKCLNLTSDSTFEEVTTLCGYKVVTDGTKEYYYFKNDKYKDVNNLKPAFLNVYAYDANGSIISSASLKQ